MGHRMPPFADDITYMISNCQVVCDSNAENLMKVTR